MAFLIQQVDGGRVPASSTCPAGPSHPRWAWPLSRAAATWPLPPGTSTPTYVSMIEKEAACAAGDIIPVMRVLPGHDV